MSEHQPTEENSTIDGYAPALGFRGFARPDGNFVFTPNQFLDLCVPHCSRGCVRVVGYLIRHLIGWRDADGNPLYDKVEVSQRELERRANVGKSSINAALAEAEALGFVLCVTRGQPNTLGRKAVQNAWTLRWEDSDTYAETLADFRGFYRGEGRRTTVPNQFFDEVLPCETHAVVKLVGTVLRHTVGYQNRVTGGRVTRAPLSFSRLAAYANCNRSTVTRALPQAISSHYITQVSRGHFAPEGQDQEASVYASCWAQEPDAPKMRPGVETGRPENAPSQTPRKCAQERPENAPSERPENAPTRNKEQRHSEKQQQSIVIAAAFLEGDEATALLVAHGFDRKAAGYLARREPLEEIRRQIEWLPHRNVTSNKTGFLRRAIEEGYGEPAGLVRSNVLREEREQRERGMADHVREARESERRRQHEEENRQSYLAHVLTLDPDVRTSCPQRHTAMLERRAEHRRLLETMPLRPEARKRTLARHDSGESLAKDLAETFPDVVADFWSWDRTTNANGLGV